NYSGSIIDIDIEGLDDPVAIAIVENDEMIDVNDPNQLAFILEMAYALAEDMTVEEARAANPELQEKALEAANGILNGSPETPAAEPEEPAPTDEPPP